MADETSNSAVVLLCGIPASGKSTLSKEIHRYAKKTRGDTIHVIYICYDDFIPRDLNLNNAIAGSQLPDKLYEEDIAKEQTKCRSESDTIEASNYSLWKHYRRILLAAVDRLLNTMKNKNNEFRFDSYNSTSEIEGLPPFHMFWKTFHENLSKEITNCSCFSPMDCRLTDSAHIILVDDNMFYHSMRYEYVQLARKYGLGFAEVFLECHLETALKRNNLRSHPVSLHTMQAIFAKMEPPDPQKFPWEHYHLTLKEEGELNAQTLENVVQLILEAQRNPLISEHEDNSEVKEASRVACLRSIVHQADQILRKYITKAIAEAKGSGKGKKELQTLASQLNKQKKVFLESVHNLKNHPHRSNTVQTVMNSTGQCLAGNEEWETSETSVSVRDLADSQKESQHGDQNCGQDTLNNSPWTSYSCFDNRKTHLCLQCFPKLEDREEFQFFVENLFKVLLL